MFLEPPFDASPAPAPGTESAAGPDIEQQLGRYVRAAQGGFSRNTERAIRSDLGIYAEWCAQQDLKALPASAETVAAFVDAMAETRKPATVRRYVASIAVAHKAIGCGKTLESPAVRLALKRMHRRKDRRQDQAKALNWPLRNRLLDAAGERLIDDRNRALLAVAYDAMLRRAELAALQVDDLFIEMRGDATLLVRRSKTDTEGRGEMRCGVRWESGSPRPVVFSNDRHWKRLSPAARRRPFGIAPRGASVRTEAPGGHRGRTPRSPFSASPH